MRRFFYALAAGGLAVAMATPVLAQTDAVSAGHQATQTAAATDGNVIVESGGAPDTDLNVARYKAWDEFQSSYPQVARALRRNHRLAGSREFVNRHPELKQLFESNAGLQQDMLRNPGNYLARMSATHHRRHRHHKTVG
jgi:hypothetical protein